MMKAVSAGKSAPGRPRTKPRNYAKWRAFTLLGVYLFIAAHIVHWKLAGRTLAPLELHEVMYTTEVGILTAGFILMAAAVLSVAIFGRFFCSWGCHLIALQDSCYWLLKKVGITPKPVRSRALVLLAPLVFGYMFLWPHVVRIYEGRPAPQLRIAGDEEGWASFVTEDFWRNLPGPWIAIATFVICGFLIVYLLGSRSFCGYACPYGFAFGLMDRVAPGRIRLKRSFDRKDCLKCGICTASCQSHIRVHEEIAEHGMVVDSRCLKDMDCVAICPSEGLHVGFGPPSLAKSFAPKSKRLASDYSWPEELLLVVSTVFGIAVFRGLYDEVPFLMSVGIGACLAFFAITTLRLFTRRDVRFQRSQLKRGGRLTVPGAAFGGTMVMFFGFVGHSAAVRTHSFLGDRQFESVRASLSRGEEAKASDLQGAISEFLWVERIGLYHSPDLDRRLGSLYELAGKKEEAIVRYRSVLAAAPRDDEARSRLANLLLDCGNKAEGERLLRELCEGKSPAKQRGRAWLRLGEFQLRDGRPAEAAESLSAASLLLDRDPEAMTLLGDALFADAAYGMALDAYRAACEKPGSSFRCWIGLGRCLLALDQPDAAVDAFRMATQVKSDEGDCHYYLGVALEARGSRAAAYLSYTKALEIDPGHGEARKALDDWKRRWGGG